MFKQISALKISHATRFAASLMLAGFVATGSAAENSADRPADPSSDGEKSACLQLMRLTTREAHHAKFESYCDRVARLPKCSSREGRPIFHVQKDSTHRSGKRILVLGLIHGDEPLAGEMTLEWADRLASLENNRSTWRIVPMLNPDGLLQKTRMNSSGVDLNRNFPTRDWNDAAVEYWEKSAKKDPRRFPGSGPASEPETKCAIAHIKDFKPEFIISNHTPYKVLDFDGPKMPFPKYKDLPWKALGNFPGSLGRYMWKDNQIPVLTVELGDHMIDSHALQDLIGTFAIEAVKRSGEKKPDLYDLL
ncbi:MAG: succinylglutamate desuccinylase/aspartoacylase family protein [Deltaproteobacteria bacterium]|jgi:protein MpaA|nr:succinylglutamate desuccinylase/aspartoacylase family protein [Deltaproteobacteria bacterium]